MDGRLTAHPLQGAGTLPQPVGDGGVEELARQGLPATRVEGIQLIDAEDAAQIAAGQVEQVRRHQLGLVAEFDAMAKDTGQVAGLARTAMRLAPINTAAMFAEVAPGVVLPGKRQSFSGRPTLRHRGKILVRGRACGDVGG